MKSDNVTFAKSTYFYLYKIIANLSQR